MNVEQHFTSWEEAVAWLKSQADQAQLVIDCYYDDPLLEAAERYRCSEEWQAIRTRLSASGRALDVGAGRGIASYALTSEGYEVTALEPDPSSLVGAGAIRALAGEAGLPIRVVEEYSERLPFADGAFDLVFARAVLHHTKDIIRACREYARVLRPGGQLVAVREHVISKVADLQVFLDQHPLHRLYGGEHAYLLAEYQSAIEDAGFIDLETISPWDSPINFAPHDLESLRDELAKRASAGLPLLHGVIAAALRMPLIWSLTRRVLVRIDDRPGRLYSFIAYKGEA